MLKFVVGMVILALVSAESYHYEDDTLLVPSEELPQRPFMRYRRQGMFGGGFNSFNFGSPYPRSYGGYSLSNLNPKPYSFTPSSSFNPSPRVNLGSATSQPGGLTSIINNIPFKYQSQNIPVSRITSLTSNTKSLSYNGNSGSASVSTVGVPGGPISGSALGSVPLARFGTTKEGGSLSFGAGADFTQGGQVQPKVELGVKGNF